MSSIQLPTLVFRNLGLTQRDVSTDWVRGLGNLKGFVHRHRFLSRIRVAVRMQPVLESFPRGACVAEGNRSGVPSPVSERQIRTRIRERDCG